MIKLYVGFSAVRFSRNNKNHLTMPSNFTLSKSLFDLCIAATRLYTGISEQRELPIQLPCLEEQTKIANFLSSLDQKN